MGSRFVFPQVAGRNPSVILLEEIRATKLRFWINSERKKHWCFFVCNLNHIELVLFENGFLNHPRGRFSHIYEESSWIFHFCEDFTCRSTTVISRISSINMGVSKNRGTPKSSILIGFSIIFTIHFGIPLFLETPIYIWLTSTRFFFTPRYQRFNAVTSQ